MKNEKIKFATAKGFVQSAYLMMNNDMRYQVSGDHPFYLSFHMLCGFAVELYLKSILIHKGLTEEDIAKPHIRHDLVKLYSACLSEGYSNDAAEKLVAMLHLNHKKHYYRYMNEGIEYGRTNISEIFGMLSELSISADILMGVSLDAGAQPPRGWCFPKEKAEWRI